MENSALDSSFTGRLRFVWRILKKQQKYLVGLLLFQIFFSLLSAVVPYFTKLQIDQLTGEGSAGSFASISSDPYALFILFLIIPAALELLRLILFDGIQRGLDMAFYRNVRQDSEDLIRKKLLTFDLGFFESERNKNLLNAAYTSAHIFTQFYRYLSQQVGGVTSLVAIIPLLGLVSWQLMVGVTVAAILQALLQKFMKQNSELNQVVKQQVQYRRQVLGGALDKEFAMLRSFGVLHSFITEFKQLEEQLDNYDLRGERIERMFRALDWTINNSLTLAVNIFTGYQVFQGNLSIGSFTLVVSYTMQLNGVFRNFLQNYSEWQEIDLDLSKLQFFFSLKSRLKSSNVKKDTLQAPIVLEMKNISFSYPDFYEDERKYFEFVIERMRVLMKNNYYSYYRYEIERWEELLKPQVSKEVLEDVNFSLQTGKLVALLGRNGAGKTTITHLLQHHYEPLSGEILLNGLPLYEYDQDFFVQQFSLLQQQPFMLESMTLRENLLLGSQKPKTEAEMWAVLEELELKDFVSGLPKQLETVIGADTSLSGGQMQLFGVARVLLEPHPIILFDEGSSQLDVEKEYLVLQALKKRQAHSAILFITHRISVARKADEILMIDRGEIVECGPHPELLKKGGLYSRFWNLQVIE